MDVYDSQFPKPYKQGIVSFVDHRYDRKLEELKGEITTKNTAMQSTVSFLAASPAWLSVKSVLFGRVFVD